MDFIPVPNCAQIEMRFIYNGQHCANVYHVQQATPYDATSLAIMADLFKTWWDDHFQVAAPNTLALVEIVARSLESDSSPAISFTAGLPLVGTSELDPQLPNSVTAAIKWTTALRGRSYRGRTFHLGLMESEVVGNTLTSAKVSALTSNYGALIDAVAGLDATLVVVSRFHNKVARTTGVATEIVGCFVDSTVDSQRRRLPGRGQ